MANQAEILSRGQASRNRYLAGVQARLQVAALLFLACADSSYMTGQVLHPNGGIVVNG